MVGIDWLQDYGVTWNFLKREIHIEGETHQLVARENRRPWCRRVVIAENTVIPPRSQLDVQTKAIFKELHADQNAGLDMWATEPGEIKDGLLVARTLLPNNADNLPVRFMNVTDKYESWQNTVVSTLEPLAPLPKQQKSHEEVKDDSIIEDMMSKVDKCVPSHIREQLKQMLERYSNVFSKDEWDLGWTDIVTHKIDVGDNKPIRQRMRRYPPSHLEAIDKHLSDMLRQGVVEPASSPWASNIVLAKKKDGTLRCCIDYRQVNEVTRKDAYPLPRTDACLDAMSGSKLFSTFDLRSGFHQVSMDPNDADKTAFVTRRGMFRFRTMPFGLCNAVATFQRLMDLVLAGLNLDIRLVYFDDIIVFSATPEQHLERLKCVFRRLQEANLKLKPSKCCLMQTEVSFLGHIISGEGISTDPEKIKLINEWPAPTNLRQLRGFLGLAGYYRRFVQGYAKIAGPLNNLLKKNQHFDWTADCQSAFDDLKRALASPPVLALPNDDGLFILDTDASEYSMGSLLSQVKTGWRRP